MNLDKASKFAGFVLVFVLFFFVGESRAQKLEIADFESTELDTVICFNPLTSGAVFSISGQIGDQPYRVLKRDFYLPDNMEEETLLDTVITFDPKTYQEYIEVIENTKDRGFVNNHPWGKVRKVDLKPGDDVVEKAEDYFEKNNTDKVILFNSEQLMICVQGSPDAKAKRKKGKGLEYEYVDGILIGKSKS